MEKIKIIALCGKAGSGKDFLLEKILQKAPHFNKIVGCTTRPVREREQKGISYFYYTPDDFLKGICNGEILEATCFNGWFYGTPLKSLKTDKVNIGVFNPESLAILQENYPNLDIKIFYISTKAKVRLERQLNREIDPNIDEIIRRYLADEKDFQYFEQTFDCQVLQNNSLEDLRKNLRVILGQGN